ncbi:MAG: type II secretion system protein [Armatimonadetes bacterium]|nr:type II secretion system protein [Armatimonadota bacterium]
MRQRHRQGITLLELIIGLAIITTLMVLLTKAMTEGSDVWIRGSSSSLAQGELRKAYQNISYDLKRTTFDNVRRAQVPASLAGSDGDALWFLSAIDPVTEQSMRNVDGTPLWQRNILYYLVVPDDHTRLYGYECAGSADANGYETSCPHKILIRKVIDNADVDGQEALIDAGTILGYLTRPTGFDVSGMAEPGLERVDVRAHSLLTMQTSLAPEPEWPNEVQVDLRAARIRSAERSVRVGSDSLQEFSFQFEFSVFPPSEP